MERKELLKVLNVRLSLGSKLLIENGILFSEVCKLCLSLSLRLSLRLLIHCITSTKLTLQSHRLRTPSKVPHRVRDVGKPSRKHGSNVRLIRLKNLVQKICIHNPCKSRDKAPRPSAFMSKPSGQLTCSTLELRAQFNLTNVTKRK